MEFNIHETFQDTVQGEGFYAGTPADFIRLYGCPVGCFFCDTGYASPDGDYYKKKLPRKKMSIQDLIDELKSPLVVLTGGEPMIHKNLSSLCEAILKTGRIVSIECSGSYWVDVPDSVYITLSPKEHISPKYPVLPIFWKRANEYKLVVYDKSEFEYYKDRVKNFKGLKYLSPEHESSDSSKHALELLMQNKEYKISIQTHKFLGLP
jgi:organic radical activating enzyme|tara:strand:+ start:7135 stop:7755 length:621 start_codon:yes stop_codon:yes gene_type:complete